MANKSKNSFKMAGVVIFKTQKNLAEYGYFEPSTLHPVVVYSENGTLKENLFYKTRDPNNFALLETVPESELGFIAEHLLQEKMTIQEATEIYPEIFL